MKDLQKKTKSSVECISQFTLYSIIAIVVLVFVAFYLIGFDNPYIADASFNAPLLTDGLLWLMYVLVAGTLGVMAFSIIKTLKTVKIENAKVNGIPAQKIAYSVFFGMLIVLLLTFVFGSTKAMLINGVMFSDKFWLRATDMLVNTIVILLLVSVVAVIFGATRYRRGKRIRK